MSAGPVGAVGRRGRPQIEQRQGRAGAHQPRDEGLARTVGDAGGRVVGKTFQHDEQKACALLEREIGKGAVDRRLARGSNRRGEADAFLPRERGQRAVSAMPRRRAIARLPGADLGGGLFDRRLHEFVGGGGSGSTAKRARVASKGGRGRLDLLEQIPFLAHFKPAPQSFLLFARGE
jgi:hypothetical protein